MKTTLPAAALASSLFATTAVLALDFQPGNLVLVRVGDGSAALSSAATAAWLDEYTTSGTFVQSIPLPTSASGPNYALTMAGSSASEGQVRLSADGHYLTVIGYNAAPGTASIAATAPATVNRVIGLVGAAGVVDSSTAIGNSLFTSNPRGVATDNGMRFWASSGSANGAFYVNSAGASATSTQLGTVATRTLGIFGGSLYASVASSTAGYGIAQVGTGLPTGAASLTLLNGFPATSSTRSTWGFSMADLNPGVAGIDTAWLADDKTSGGDAPGIQKWVFDGTIWSLSYTISTGTGTGARAVTADLSGANPVLFVTTTDNKVERIVDLGASSSAETIITGVANTFFRGVDFTPTAIPEPQGLILVGGLALLAWNFVRRRG